MSSLCFLTLLLVGCAPLASMACSLTFATFNIRYAPGQEHSPPAHHSSHSSRSPSLDVEWGERPWRDRLPYLADLLTFHRPDIIGFQEALHHQLSDLGSFLREEYDWVGVGRDDGREAGEAVPVFWRRGKVALEGVEYVWLSKTPDVPGSKDWDAGQTRMVTIAKFALLDPPSSTTSAAAATNDTADPRLQPQQINYDPDPGPDLLNFQSRSSLSPPHNTKLWVLNTHWDDRGVRSRTEAAKIILGQVKTIVEKAKKEGGEEPLVVLLGDLNSPAEEEGYRTLTGRRYVSSEEKATPLSAAEGPTFLDARHELLRKSRKSRQGEEGGLLQSAPFGEHYTFTGFEKSDERQIIDFVMFTNTSFSKNSEEGKRGWEVTRYGVLPNRFEGGFFISDHRCVLATLERRS